VTAPRPARPAGVRAEVHGRAAALSALRRDLHQHPEPGFREERTAGVVAARLREAGLWVREGIARTGVLARTVSRGTGAIDPGRAGPGPAGAAGGPASARSIGPPSDRAVLFRADMDALPLQEETGAPYASTVPGYMHACGHDGHTAILVETATLLQQTRALAGPGRECAFAFQPAEEGPGGALPMIEAGILEDAGAEAVFGLHLWSGLPTGRIAVTPGPVMASADEFEIRVLGRGGHAAHPQDTIDAVVVGSQIVTALQTLVSRNTDPLATAVLTVGTFHAGSNFNIIAERAVLRGTLRTFDVSLRSLLVRRLRETVEGVARALGAEAEFEFQPYYPPTVNHPLVSEYVAELAAQVVGERNVVRDMRLMGAEDFSFFLRRRPGCFFFVGSGNAARGFDQPHHSPRFDLDEEALPIGCEMFLRIAETWFDRFPEPLAAPEEEPWG